nr:MAG TPA: hypothetical protein [Bacteriophage sp.]
MRVSPSVIRRIGVCGWVSFATPKTNHSCIHNNSPFFKGFLPLLYHSPHYNHS